MDFDFNEVLKIRIKNGPSALAKDLNVPWMRFQKPFAGKADIEVQCGPFSKNCFMGVNVDHHFFIQEGSINFSKKIPGASYKVLVQGLESPHTKVYFSQERSLVHFLKLAPLQKLITEVLQPLFEIKMAQKKYYFLHGAGLRSKNKTILLLGRGGAFKSTISYKAVQSGAQYFGDDLLLFDKNKIYPFPTHTQYFQYYMDQNLQSEKSLSLGHKICLALKLMRYKRYDLPISDPAPPTHAVWVDVRHGKMQPTIAELPLEQLIYKAGLNCEMEREASIPTKDRIGGFLDAYRMAYPNCFYKNHWHHHHRTLKSLMNNASGYQLTIGSQWDEGIMELLERL